MENEYTSGNDQPAGNLLGITIEGETRNKLQTITVWSNITAIGGFVNMALGLIGTITTFGSLSHRAGATWLIVTNLLSLAISFFLNFFLWQFSKNLKFSLENENQESFVVAAIQLKAYMRMLGILLITSIALGIISSLVIGGAVRRF